MWSPAQTTPAPADSIAQTETSLTDRYVNATSLTLRTRPDATATASATIAGASRVQLVEERAAGWSQVQVSSRPGYVRSEYLVEEQQLITAEVDWASVEAPVARVPPAPEVVANRPQLLATLNGLNARFGRGTVRLSSAGASWRPGALAGTRPLAERGLCHAPAGLANGRLRARRFVTLPRGSSPSTHRLTTTNHTGK